MKMLFVLLQFIIVYNISFAQTNTFPSSGHVGIGTTNPISQLSIRGGDTGVSIHPGTSPYFGTLAFNRESYSGQIMDPNGFAYQINNGGTDANLHFQIYNGTGGMITNDALVICSTGNVGIGLALPPEKLSVNGKIRAKEIKVENINWPDFVFAKSYVLPTLQEIENHIKEKGHLPRMPSAVEVKAHGVDLGEINAKLLQKIEELTLHLIELKKEVDILRNPKRK